MSFTAFGNPPAPAASSLLPSQIPLPLDVDASAMVLMPSPQGKNALQFKGKDMDMFLDEFNHHAEMAQLSDKKKC